MATADATRAPAPERTGGPLAGAERKAASRGGPVVAAAGAIALIASLFASWYALQVPAAFRTVLEAQAKRLPPELRDAGRSVAAGVPSRVEANAWEVFQATDVALLVCRIVVVALSLLALGIGPRAARARLAGAAGPITFAGLAATAVVTAKLIDQPDPQQLFSLEPGGFVALAGALSIALGGWLAGRSRPSVRARS